MTFRCEVFLVHRRQFWTVMQDVPSALVLFYLNALLPILTYMKREIVPDPIFTKRWRGRI